MKVLAVATIVLSIPNIVFGAYGMNLAADGMPLANAPHAFFIIIVLSVILSLLVWWYIDHRKMY
jgi:magnesium transporter